MLEQIAIGAISAATGVLTTYAIIRRTFSDEAILRKVEAITDEVMINQEFQKKIYSIGALIGSGIAQGTGIQRKSGKFGLEDLIMQVAGNFIAGKAGNLLGQTTTSTHTGNAPKTLNVE